MNKYHLIVVGSGAGMNVAGPLAEHGARVAVIDRDPLGGTCLNRGCIPSKVWTTAADAIREAQAAASIGVTLSLEAIDYDLIRERTWEIVLEGRESMEKGVAAAANIDFYNGVGRFIGDRTFEVEGEQISGERVVIAAGARPALPPIAGLGQVPFLTNREIFELRQLPESLLIVGGGYIACELAHFFSAMGTEVTLVGRNERLLPDEDPEVSELVARVMRRHLQVLTGVEARKVSIGGAGIRLVGHDQQRDQAVELEAAQILIAAGRRPNADLLQPEAGGVEVDPAGWIVTNELLETTAENVWALGDCVNRGQFRHTANAHSGLVLGNAFGDRRDSVDEHAIPSAVFCWPQVGSVGLTADQAVAAGLHVHVGKAQYDATAKGFALGEREGFAKVVVDAESGRILGAAVVGPQASVLVQLVVDAMNAGDGTMQPFAETQIIHPALSEVVVRALGNLSHLGGEHDHQHHH